MSFKNTDTQYGALAKLLHWAGAFIILGLCIVGFIMVDMAYSPEKLQLYANHKSFGLLILLLVLLRIGWKFLSPAPAALTTHQAWEKLLAKGAHLFLYFAMIAMPLSGWVMSSAGEFPVTFFGLTLPPLTGKDETLFELSKFTHWLLAYGLMGVIGLHAAGAFKHHIIDKDETLSRMMFAKHPAAVFGLIGILGAFFATVAYFTFMPLFKSQVEIQTTDTQIEITQTETDNALPPHSWIVDKENTSINFEASMYGQNFTGIFNDYDADIIFNPDDLSAGNLTVRIRTNSAVTGNADRDSQITTEDWFFAESYPEAIFQSRVIEQMEGSNYLAIGDLTLRGVTMPVRLYFTLEIQGKTAEVTATADLNRLDYGIGQGDWQNTDTVGADVAVQISLIARQP